MAEQLSRTHERAADLPLLLGLMQRPRLQELLERDLGNHGHQQGFSNGWWASIWLAFIRSVERIWVDPPVVGPMKP